MRAMQIIGLIAQICTAIGTIGAVITSLWFSRSSQKIKVHATIDFKTIYSSSSKKPHTYNPNEEVVIIEIVNIGIKPFKVYSFGCYDKKSKTSFLITPDYAHSHCTKLNQIYSESESGCYVFPIEIFTKNLMKALKITDHNEVISRLKNLTLIITTNLHQNIKIKLDKKFQNECFDLVQKDNLIKENMK